MSALPPDWGTDEGDAMRSAHTDTSCHADCCACQYCERERCAVPVMRPLVIGDTVALRIGYRWHGEIVEISAGRYRIRWQPFGRTDWRDADEIVGPHNTGRHPEAL